MSELVIKFQGAEYLLIGTLERGGSIATREQYANGECSYAHLNANGNVMRFHDSIGHRDEIEVIGTEEPEVKASLLEMLTHPSWDRK